MSEEFKGGTLADIPVAKIKENPSALRACNRQSEAFAALVESVKVKGVLIPILVRPVEKSDEFMLIDGLHRFSAAQEAGLESISARVVSMNDVQSLEAQIVANIHKVQTKPVEYGRQLQRLLAADPTLSIERLSNQLGLTASWVKDRLNLQQLDKDIAELVDNARIEVSKGILLSKLPVNEQKAYAQDALNKTTAELADIVTKRCKEVRDALKQGRAANPVGFIPAAHMRKIVEVKTELDTHAARASVLEADKPQSIEEAFDLGIKFVLNLDSQSVAAAKQKWEDAQKESAEKAKKRAADNAAKAGQKLPDVLQDALNAAQKAGVVLDVKVNGEAFVPPVATPA